MSQISVQSSPIISWQIDGEIVETVTDFLFLGSKITTDGDCNHFLLLGRKVWQTWRIKKQRHYFANKGLPVKAMVFPVVIWTWVGTIENWVLKNGCFWTVVLKTLASPRDCKIKPINPDGNQSWILIGKNDDEAETPVLFGRLMQRTDSLGKDLDAGQDLKQKGIYMEFRKMVTITLYATQKKIRCLEQIFGLCGRRRGWDDLRE